MKDVHKLKGSYEELIDGLDLTVQQKILLKLTWLDYLLLLDKSARRGWVSFNYSQLIVILFSLTQIAAIRTKVGTGVEFHFFSVPVCVLQIFVL